MCPPSLPAPGVVVEVEVCRYARLATHGMVQTVFFNFCPVLSCLVLPLIWPAAAGP